MSNGLAAVGSEAASEPQHSMSLEAELFTTERTTWRLVLGSHDVFQFETVTPAHTFGSIVRFCPPAIPVQLIARDSFSEPLATFLLDQIDEFGLPDHPGPLDSVRVRPHRRHLFPASGRKVWRRERG